MRLAAGSQATAGGQGRLEMVATDPGLKVTLTVCPSLCCRNLPRPPDQRVNADHHVVLVSPNKFEPK